MQTLTVHGADFAALLFADVGLASVDLHDGQPLRVAMRGKSKRHVVCCFL